MSDKGKTPQEKPTLASQMEREIQQYLTEEVFIDDIYHFSTHKIQNRIRLFETHTYPKGKFDSQGNYKFWFDINTTRIESEIKNIDFDTSNVVAYSPLTIDEVPLIIINLKIDEYLRVTGQAEEINSAIEEGAGWGNIVWKKVKGGYERVDLPNFYVINQTARTLDDSPAIERHQFTSSQLRAKKESWENVGAVLTECQTKTYKTNIGTQEQNTTVPYYEVYERNGEVNLKDLKEARKEKVEDGDEDKFVLAKVIGAGTKGNKSGVEIKYILFADEIKGKKMSDIYKEYHRSRYKGRWWREGIYELLFDLQVRANQIGNQISQGLELAAKTVLTSDDKLIVQNILTDIRNGDIITGKNIQQINLRMDAFDQLFADWNRIIALADSITNSREIVQGITPASGTPLGTSKLLNENAGKLYDFIREKLGIPFSKMFEEWMIPEQIKKLKQQEILRLTGNSELLNRLHKILVDDWYLENLVFLPPHTKEIADQVKLAKLEELKTRPELLMKAVKHLFDKVKPKVSVIITGEQLNLSGDLQVLAEFASLEADPIRRSAILEMMARKKGLDFGSLPKTEQGLQTIQPPAQAPTPAPAPAPAPAA